MPRLAKSLETLRSQVNELAPKRSKKNDGWIGDPAHAARKSDHNPNKKGVVQAIDITHDPKGGADSYALADLLRVKRDRRIKYVISNGRIFSSTEKPWQWRKYTGSNLHTAHVHISVSDVASLYDDPAPWSLDGFVKAPPPPDVEPVRAVSEEPKRMRWWEKWLTWLSGGGAGGVAAFGSIDNWQVAAIFGVVLLIAGGVVWFTYVLPKLRARRK